MRSRNTLALLALAVCAAACDRRPAAPATPPASAPAASTPIASPSPPRSAARGTPCGDLGCTQFESPEEAFLQVIASDPLVLGVGEAHAPKGATAPSSARRFAGELLPLLRGRASDLLVELMMPPKGCADAAAEVREKQQPITMRQAESDQNEYVAMGDRARALGIVPDMLRPSCADLDALRDAGDQVVDRSLSTIARLTTLQATRLIDRDMGSDADRGKVIVIYGGALHNDLQPTPDAAAWSYAPALDAHVQGRFVALDLIVPEYIGDDPAWRAFPWWAHYDRARLGAKATLFRVAERSFALVLPVTAGPRDE